MNYSLGDRVQITAIGKTGSICDINVADGHPLYIVDCFGECDSESLEDCVITVEEHEIEPIRKSCWEVHTMANKKIIKIDEDAEARINAAYARAAGVKPMSEMPEFQDFGKKKANTTEKPTKGKK